jgi:hypothetical protein
LGHIGTTSFRDEETELILVNLSIVRVHGPGRRSSRLDDRFVEKRLHPFLVIENMMADLWIG